MPNSSPLSYPPLIGQRTESSLPLVSPMTEARPPVDALSDDDLERMKFAALQSDDLAKAQRIDEIRRLRRQFGLPDGTPIPQQQPVGQDELELLRGDKQDKRTGLLPKIQQANPYRQLNEVFTENR